MTNHWQKRAEQVRDDCIQELIRLLRINSVEDMSTAREGQPFGTGVAEALDFFLDKGAADGFVTRNLEGYAGYIEFGEGEEQVGVLDHLVQGIALYAQAIYELAKE